MKGFTLIEMMIVVALIGILAVIAIPQFASLLNKAQEGAVKGQLGGLRSSINIYYSDMDGQYPADLTTGITTALNLIPSLPLVRIPPAAGQNNPGHLQNNAEGLAGQGQSCPPNMGDFADTQAWYYFPFYVGAANTACAGTVYIHCTHNDSRGTVWTSY